MTEKEITCIVHNENKVITHVGLDDIKQPVADVVDLLSRGVITAHTLKDGRQARVYPKENKLSGRWFLTTNPDDTQENNLDFLRQCP